MRSFQKKRGLKRLMQSRPFLIFFGILLLVFIVNMFSFLGRMEETRKNKQLLQNKILELEKSKTKLESDISSLKTEKGIEENIREKFGVAKEGEDMIMIVDDKNSTPIDQKADSGQFLSTFKSWFK